MENELLLAEALAKSAKQAVDSLIPLFEELGVKAAESNAQHAAMVEKVAVLEAKVQDLENLINPKPQPAARLAIPLEVVETSGVLRKAGELVFAGVPLSEEMNIKQTNQLAVTAEDQTLVHADIRATALWKSRRAPEGIQWIQVVFPLLRDLAPNEKVVYSLLVDVPENTNPKPVKRLLVQAVGSAYDLQEVHVETGTAVFHLDGLTIDPFLDGAGGAFNDGFSASFEGKTSQAGNNVGRKMYVEYAGTLVAYVVQEFETELVFGEEDGRAITVRRRIEFRAGSGTALVQQRVAWEGTHFGPAVSRDGKLNAVLGQLMRETFVLSGITELVRVLDQQGSDPLYIHDLSGPVSLHQTLRTSRLQMVRDKKVARPGRYEISTGGAVKSWGQEANGGMLALKNNSLWFTATLQRMHCYEPQRLLVEGNKLYVDLASDKFWLAHHQGVCVTYALSVSKEQPDFEGLWATVNWPLRGLAPTDWYGKSGAVAELPSLDLPPDLAIFREAQKQLVQNTLLKRREEGLQGLMTWGLWARGWGEWGVGTGELGSGFGAWDQLYKEGAFTDYWNTTKTAVEYALIERDPKVLDDLAFPAALRMLHTQIVQGAPNDPWPYIGSAAYGYGAYRSDFNSSHQYWDNLFWYFWLTGDQTVVETIERGAVNESNRFHSGVTVSGRQPMQWLSTFRFLGHAINRRSTPLRDWSKEFDTHMRRSIQEQYVEVNLNNDVHGFWMEGKRQPTGMFQTQQNYTTGHYDMENIYWYGVRNENEPVSNVRPFDVIVRTAHTMATLGSSLAGGNGTPNGALTRLFRVVFSQGVVKRVELGVIDGQDKLFPDDVPAMASWLSRAAKLGNDPETVRFARALVLYGCKQVLGRGIPFGKLMGLVEGRLATAVAWEAGWQKPALRLDMVGGS